MGLCCPPLHIRFQNPGGGVRQNIFIIEFVKILIYSKITRLDRVKGRAKIIPFFLMSYKMAVFQNITKLATFLELCAQ